MITKLFEVRDRATFIPVIAIKAVPGYTIDRTPMPTVKELESERYLLRRAGYNLALPSIILVRAHCSGIDRNATYDAYAWGATQTRTLMVAHQHIERNFDALETGAVIDVEFILGETEKPKVSERITAPDME